MLAGLSPVVPIKVGRCIKNATKQFSVSSVIKYFAGSSSEHICCVYSSMHICWPLHFSCGATESIAQRAEVFPAERTMGSGAVEIRRFHFCCNKERGGGLSALPHLGPPLQILISIFPLFSVVTL